MRIIKKSFVAGFILLGGISSGQASQDISKESRAAVTEITGALKEIGKFSMAFLKNKSRIQKIIDTQNSLRDAASQCPLVSTSQLADVVFCSGLAAGKSQYVSNQKIPNCTQNLEYKNLKNMKKWQNRYALLTTTSKGKKLNPEKINLKLVYASTGEHELHGSTIIGQDGEVKDKRTRRRGVTKVASKSDPNVQEIVVKGPQPYDPIKGCQYAYKVDGELKYFTLKKLTRPGSPVPTGRLAIGGAPGVGNASLPPLPAPPRPKGAVPGHTPPPNKPLPRIPGT